MSKIPILLCALALGCTQEPAGDGGAAANTPAPLSPTCAPNVAQPCPCPAHAGALGMQACAADGRSFGACTGCPVPPAAGSGGASAAAGAGGSAGGSAPAAGAGAGAGGGSGASGADAAGSGGAAGSSAAPDLNLDLIVAEPGTSCGVGLVSLCALGAEKCCVRSLATDTCITAAEACTCELPSCSVMEASCDGPEDCGQGEVCCGTLSGGTSYTAFACATQCDNQGMQREACHQDMTECPAGLECANSQLLTNVQVCIDPATIQQ